MEISIEKIVYGGYGLARTEEGVILVQGDILPGDVIEITGISKKKGAKFAEEYRILKPSPLRTSSDCLLFPKCGGCRFRNISYEAEQEIKNQMIEDLISRNHIPAESPQIIPTKPLRYRNRITWHFFRGQIGFWSREKREFLPTLTCPLGKKEMEDVLWEIGAGLPPTTRAVVTRQHGGKVLVIMVVREPAPFNIDRFPPRGKWAGLVTVVNPKGKVLLHGKIHNSWGKTRLTHKLAGIELIIPPRAFFQVNDDGLQKLYDIVSRYADGGAKIVDLYAGVGTFILPLSERYEWRVAVEANRESANALKTAAKNHKIKITVLPIMAEEAAEAVLENTSLLLLDPPRSGLSEEVKSAIIKHLPERLIYLSCHPPAMFRDIRQLGEKYKLVALHAVDMFPRTWHFEMLAVLERR